MAQYAQEERNIREENLRLQRRLQLEMERRENLCRHLSESESSLEMDDERSVAISAQFMVARYWDQCQEAVRPAVTAVTQNVKFRRKWKEIYIFKLFFLLLISLTFLQLAVTELGVCACIVCLCK